MLPMATYVESIRRGPRTLTDREQRALVRVTGEHRAGFRDHLLYIGRLPHENEPSDPRPGQLC